MRPAGGWWFEWCRLVSLFSFSRSFFTLPCDFFSGLYLPRASTAPLPLGCRQTCHSPQFFHFGVRPLFLCRCVSFFLPPFLQGAEETPPLHDNPPQTSVRQSIPTPPSRHESLSRPIKQITVKSVPVPAPVFVCQHRHSVFTIRTRRVSPFSPVSTGLVLPSPGSSGFRLAAAARVPATTTTVCSLPFRPTLRSPELDPVTRRHYFRVIDKQIVGHLWSRVYQAVISREGLELWRVGEFESL